MTARGDTATAVRESDKAILRKADWHSGQKFFIKQRDRAFEAINDRGDSARAEAGSAHA